CGLKERKVKRSESPHAELHEMNTAPQPITGPPSNPHPAPSPGLSQPTFPQPPVVFAPPPQQMNPSPQPRQPYYAGRPGLPGNAPRGVPSSAPRPIGPTHIYQPMMISQQQLPYPSPPQQAYFIPSPGQYRPAYVTTSQQYSVSAGSPAFYPGTSPAEYPPGTYAGTYYPATPGFPTPVPTAPVIMSPAPPQQQPPQQQPQQQQPPAPPPQQISTKRERKQIRIRDPNQGGRDITEEIMSGGRSESTPTPPQTSDDPTQTPAASEGSGATQANGENPSAVTPTVRPDDRGKATPPPSPADVMDAPPPRGPSPAPLSAPEVPAYPAPLPASVPAPLPASTAQDKPPTQSEEEEQEEEEVQEPKEMEEPAVSLPSAPPPGPAPLESPIAQPEELRLPNGLPLPAPLDPEGPLVATPRPVRDDSPIAEPEVALVLQQQQRQEVVAATATTTVTFAMPAALSVPAAPVAPVVQATVAVAEQPAVEEGEETPVQEEVAVVVAVVAAVETSPSPPPEAAEDREDTPPPPPTALLGGEASMQAAVSVPKKKRKMKDLNKKEAVGSLLDAFTEEKVVAPLSEPEPSLPPLVDPPLASSPAPEEEETWEEKEDKLDAENIEPDAPKASDAEGQKYQYKGEQWKPIDPEDKKRYDRDFLLRFQFNSASMNKPEGLPHISDVVLDKANKTPLRQLDPSRLSGMNLGGPDFTPSYANLGRPNMGGGGGRGPPPGMGGGGMGGPRRSQQGQQRKEPRKIITTMSLSDDIQLNKAEKAWKPGVKKARSQATSAPEEESEAGDPEQGKTDELFKRVRSVLNKLTPQMFQQLMKQVTDLTIDTEDRLKGVIDLIFEKAISEPNFSVAYANMCRCLMGLKVPTTDKPGVTVNFRKLLLNRCQKEFEKDRDDDEFFEMKQKELDAASGEEEKQQLKVALEEAKDKARRRSLGNIKFIGELFKLKMLTEVIMHDCIVKLLKNHDEESLECLCRLLSTIGKDLDFEKAKPRMDQYFHQMDKIIKEKKTSSRIRFMLQDVIDLRWNSWVPRRGDQGPKTIDQIHKEAEQEEVQQQMKVQQQLLFKNDGGGGGGGGRGGRMGGGHGGRGGPHTPGQGRGAQPQDEGWNTVPISTKNRPIDTSRLSKITKPGSLDFNNQLLAPGGKGMWGSWGKGSSGGSSTKPAGEVAPEPGTGGRPATSTLNRFSALQQPPSSSAPSSDSDRRVLQRNSSSRERSDRFDRPERFDRRDDERRREERGGDRNRGPLTKRSFSREKDSRSRERDHRGPPDAVRRVASMTDDRGSRERARSKDNVKRESASIAPPRPQTPSETKPALTEEELEKKSTAIIEEYLHINDIKEALQCVQEMSSSSLLFVFVRNGLESTLERSAIARQRMGVLLQQLIKAGTLSTEQYYKGLHEVLEVADDMAIDIPHIWLYLGELIAPMLHEGGIPMGPLFKEISKPLIPQGKAGVLLVQVLALLCKGMSHKKAGSMWREAGLSWNHFLPEGQDVNKFVTEQDVEFTLGDSQEERTEKKAWLGLEEIGQHLERLIQDKADNQRIFDWIEANLDEQQTSSNMFVRALMKCVCQSAIICETPYKVDSDRISQRSKLLLKYLKDEQKELQGLYSLQALLVEMEQPANLLRIFFDTLYDEDVIKEEAFYQWEISKDPAEQQGKGVALKSVTAFFTWLREAEEESDNS
ncbi:eukaryotic translation initiation factor 4 gamma 1-like, partial [Aplochiton taeniatus]